MGDAIIVSQLQVLLQQHIKLRQFHCRTSSLESVSSLCNSSHSRKFDTSKWICNTFLVCHVNTPVALLWSSRGWRAGRPGDVRQQQEADGAQHEQQETLLLQGAWGGATAAEEVAHLQLLLCFYPDFLSCVFSREKFSLFLLFIVNIYRLPLMYSSCLMESLCTAVSLFLCAPFVLPERCCEIQRWGTSWSPTPPTSTTWPTWDQETASRSLKTCQWYIYI